MGRELIRSVFGVRNIVMVVKVGSMEHSWRFEGVLVHRFVHGLAHG